METIYIRNTKFILYEILYSKYLKNKKQTKKVAK